MLQCAGGGESEAEVEVTNHVLRQSKSGHRLLRFLRPRVVVSEVTIQEPRLCRQRRAQ